MTNNKKFEMNKRQIIKTANQKSLMDVVDNLDTVHQTKGTYNKKLLLNINNFADKTHKEKQASFYWDMEQALLVAEDIISGRFKDTFYNPKAAGVYSQYGGGQYSRVLNIGYKDGKYFFQVALYKPIKTKTGAILPDKNNPVDNHSIQVAEFETRVFMMGLKAHITAKLAAMMLLDMNGADITKQPVKTEIMPPEEHYEAPVNYPQDNNEESVDDLNAFLNTF